MESLETIVLVGVLIIMASVVAPRLRVPVPLVLLISGVLVGFVPQVREIHLPSEAVLVLFLPALLFWESLTTSLREIRRDLRGILLLSTVLVVVTALGIAGLGTALGMTWGAALILGAALAPTDATAVSSMAKSLPHRNMTLLRAESLINDGTALVLFTIAVGVAVGGIEYSASSIAWLLVVSYVGGAVIGLVSAWLGTYVLRRLSDPLVISTVLVVLPFAAFLLAELVHASGVIAVVVAGLFITQSGPRVSTPRSRQQTFGFWTLATSLLNGALFALIGIEAQSAVRAVAVSEIGPLIALTLAAWIGLLIIRFVFQVAVVALIRLIDRRSSQYARRMPNRARVVSTVAGFRGAVSLAVALAVPVTFSTGEAFPGRDQVIFVAAGVVLLTLVVQGVLLPPVLRWADLPSDTTRDDELELAEHRMVEEAVRALPDVARSLGVDEAVTARLQTEYEEHRALLSFDPDSEDYTGSARRHREMTQLRLAMIAPKQAAILELRDARIIGDTTLVTIQARLDREALRLVQPEVLE
ncbi:Na+/H+ antiporter [Rhodococcus sp. 06-156-3C]|uniref:Na+/H+ antiporter n=1 Tax=Nocardiaceae TaxID=85025 RepID=UPI000522F54A|nr:MULTISPECIES: Na+/H+ antiporter [Rhodococcus]OZD13035.1 Na+/H+ antiporter [Rhodococcus sp. 06-156-4a]OZD17904.1 Na+/H+ antiporter [Rhodococcus sp. 06-156-3C]OZD20628.1 Na+/H+ antiporter [Rhodococcus sp. 06-156-4C]OZD30654.1 Na+/H+ antiporter [Rhodococcus sp. 06-156-3b]OZD32574.1 Na+/H+ antiporter [Rhodococcus sp. 06-156-3]